MIKKPVAYASAVAGLVLIFSTTGCSKSTDRTARTDTNGPATTNTAKAKRALVRFVNAEPEGGPLDLWFGDEKAFSGIAFRTATNYQELPAERREFKLRFSGKDVGDPLATNSEGLSDGKYYTIVAMPKKGNKNNITLNAMNDDTDNPPAGKVRVRVVNADKDAGEVDLAERGRKDAVIGGIDVDSSTGVLTRKRWPSADTSYEAPRLSRC